jgi:hypothetical protein
MNILTVDYETYYAQDFSLSGMQTDAYCLDPRFEIILVSVMGPSKKSVWFSGTMEETKAWLARFPWEECAFLSHNVLFDGFIHTQVMGLPSPALWLDTLGMARAIYPYLPSHSLKSVASYLGVGEKGTEVEDAKGKRRVDFTSKELDNYAFYCMNDGAICRASYDIMEPKFPLQETVLLDQRIRMFTEPRLQLNEPALSSYLADTLARKQALMDHPLLVLGDVQRDQVMSNAKFAEVLRSMGVEPPLKTSKTTGKTTYAFAKTDEGMTNLQEHENPEVQAVVAARLGNKSTIAETRAQKFVETARRGRGWPVYMNYWGAKTTGRDSGGNSINALNLPNRGADRVIRESIEAPPGFMIVVGDSANIELRVNFVLSGQEDLVDRIRQYDDQGKAATSDLYCDFASQIFGKVVTKDDEKERFIGKTGELGLGYGCGPSTFGNMLRVQGGMKVEEQELQRVVNLYRETHKQVQNRWRNMDSEILPAIAKGEVGRPVDVYGWFLTNDRQGFSLPGELGVQYHSLSKNDDGEWKYQLGKLWPYIYGGKGWENVCVDGDALVLTDHGWVPLRLITREKIHDGVEFVAHGGTVLKGNLECVTVDGVYMTPDHEVMTHVGWQAASQSPEPYRPVIRTAYCDTIIGERWEEIELAVRMRLRSKGIQTGYECDERSETRRNTELRMRNQCSNVKSTHKTWNEPSPGLSRLAQHGGSMSTSNPSGVGKLRRSWNSCVQAVGTFFRSVLGRYGTHLHGGADVGPTGQQQGIHTTELPVEILQGAGVEQAREHWFGSEDHVRGEWSPSVDVVLPVRKKSPVVEVWDLVDCGPRNRFVVLGKKGPFIVHNCQHAARQIVMWQGARVGLKFPVVLEVYDEIVALAPEDRAEECRDWMQECLMLAPKWCRGVMPLNGKVGVGRTYGSAH